MDVSLIVATDKNLGIGKYNQLPWKLKSEMNFFKNKTQSKTPYYTNIVIMGRNTWESIPEKFKPLKNRINIILSSNNINLGKYQNTYYSKNVSNAINFINSLSINIGEVFIIGGQKLYHEILSNSDTELYNLDYIYQTEIYKDFDCDTFLYDKKEYKKLVKHYDIIQCSEFQEESGIYFRYITYKKCITEMDLGPEVKVHYALPFVPFKNEEEYQYLNILKKIIDCGIKREDRTGTGTISVFGETQEFNLRDTFPMLTTKRIFFRGIFEELMLYLRGQTDNKILNEKGLNIWNGNTSREFLDKRGLNHYEEGDMGETYGFNFRHFGGEYLGCSHQYEKGEHGFDQLANVIHLIKNDPTSRRIIISLWNPHTNHKAALPSCLCWYQFYVDTEREELNLQIYLRSSDFFLANNWNVCTGALLVHMLCNLKGIQLTPGILKVVTGDTHLYINHLDQVKINLERTPKPYPKLLIKEKKDNIEDFKFEDLELLGYNPYPGIKAEMSV
jgi:dihydrofolate reductase / thymidylate synthase